MLLPRSSGVRGRGPAGLSCRQPGSVQAVQDQAGGKGDHLFQGDLMPVYFPLPVDHTQADRKVGDDQIALKAVIFRKAVILPEEMFSDEIRGIQTFGEMTFA